MLLNFNEEKVRDTYFLSKITTIPWFLWTIINSDFLWFPIFFCFFYLFSTQNSIAKLSKQIFGNLEKVTKQLFWSLHTHRENEAFFQKNALFVHKCSICNRPWQFIFCRKSPQITVFYERLSIVISCGFLFFSVFFIFFQHRIQSQNYPNKFLETFKKWQNSCFEVFIHIEKMKLFFKKTYFLLINVRYVIDLDSSFFVENHHKSLIFMNDYQ